MDPTSFARILLLTAILAISSPSAVTTPVTPIPGYTIYVVQDGDTLQSLAGQFFTSVGDLEKTNHLSDGAFLVPGQKILVPDNGEGAAGTPTPAPSSGAATLTVKAGDTLFSIASSAGVSVDDLARANGIVNRDSLSIGQVLTIPGKAPVASAAPNGVELIPATVRQGNTLEFKITASNAVTATGTFNSRLLQFVQDNGVLFALAGISRCAATVTYQANIAITTKDGPQPPVNFPIKVNPTNYPVQDITLTPGMASLLDPAIEIAENNRVADTVTPFSPAAAWSDAFKPPLGAKDKDAIITALFGTRRSYNGGAVGLCGHEGQDFAIDGGTPVYAPAGGVIVLADPLHVRGNVIAINHGQGVYSAFFHLSEIDVKDGQTVKTGDLLGKVGTTGFSTGNHLHWSMWAPAGVPDPGLENRKDVYVDPIEWENRTIP